MRTYTIQLDDKTIDLRITIASQMKLAKKYNEPVLSTVFTAVQDPARIVDVFTEALNFKGNENTVKSGAELYDLLVDDNKSGTEDFMEILAGIAEESGLITSDQRVGITDWAKKQSGDMVDSLKGKNQ